ncbi:MAG: nucleotide pyrophosphohydrolase, partial [Arthrobacter sp.]|nr:nucleotide pyrophosphohydrolase [Arthrobacter sp.]
RAERAGLPAAPAAGPAAVPVPGARGLAPGTEEELGELLFGIVAAARADGLDAERALRAAIRRFQDCQGPAPSISRRPGNG